MLYHSATKGQERGLLSERCISERADNWARMFLRTGCSESSLINCSVGIAFVWGVEQAAPLMPHKDAGQFGKNHVRLCREKRNSGTDGVARLRPLHQIVLCSLYRCMYDEKEEPTATREMLW